MKSKLLIIVLILSGCTPIIHQKERVMDINYKYKEVIECINCTVPEECGDNDCVYDCNPQPCERYKKYERN